MIIHQYESGVFNIRESQKAYEAQGRPRQKMIRELFIRIRAVLPNASRECIRTQVRLAANAILVTSNGPFVQPRKKGLTNFGIKKRTHTRGGK
jgi:hypothetical protein